MVLEVIRKENERLVNQGIKQGMEQGIRNIVIQMLKIGMKEELIYKVTNIKQEELEKIKKKIL